MVCAIIAAAGKGSRAGLQKNKILFSIDGKKVIERTVSAFLGVEEISRVIICASGEDIGEIKEIFRDEEKVEVVLGGENRTQSVYKGLSSAKGCDIVLIHDGARPFVSPEIIKECIESVRQHGSGIAALPVTDTLCVAEDGYISGYRERTGHYYIQTPQGFLYDEIMAAYRKIKEGEEFTDDSSVYLKYHGRPRIAKGGRENIKITFAEDFAATGNRDMRTGTGYDSHRFCEGRKFILGGVEIDYEKGLLGHSDGDALLHAIIDSLFSAAGLSDIGSHFPDTSPEYKGADSLKLLQMCRDEVYSAGYRAVNVSAVIMCQWPKLAPYIPKMRENIAKALGTDTACVGISAKTNEGMGFVGQGEGITVIANCLLEKNL